MGLLRRTLPNQKPGPGFLLYFGIFVGVFVLGWLFLHRNDEGGKKPEPPARPVTVTPEVGDVVASGAGVQPLPKQEAPKPTGPENPLATPIRVAPEQAETVNTPTKVPEPAREKSPLDAIDVAQTRVDSAPIKTAQQGAALPDFGGVQASETSNGGKQGKGQKGGHVVFGATRAAPVKDGQNQSNSGEQNAAPVAAGVEMSFPTPQQNALAAKGARNRAVAADSAKKNGFQTGDYLPANYRIHVRFRRGFQTFSGENSVVMVVDEPVRFLGKVQIPAGLQILGSSAGNDFVRNRILIRTYALQYPNGERTPVAGLLKGEDDAVGVPAYFHDAPLGGVLIPFVNTILTDYLDSVKNNQLAYVQASLIARAVPGASQPATPAYDPKTTLINATSEAVHSYMEARMAYYTRIYQPYLEVERGMTAWIEVQNDTDLLPRTLGSMSVPAAKRVSGAELDSLPTAVSGEQAPSSAKSSGEPALGGLSNVNFSGLGLPTTQGPELPATPTQTTPVQTTPRSGGNQNQGDPLGDLLGLPKTGKP